MKQIIYLPEDYSDIAEFVYGRIGYGKKPEDATAIGIKNNGIIIAGVVYSGFNGSNLCADIAGIGKDWITRDFLWFMFFYPFMQAGAKRITAIVEANNLQSQKFVEKLGFELEFSMKSAGRFGDLKVYRMFKEDCKYLERRNGKSIRREKRRATRGT